MDFDRTILDTGSLTKGMYEAVRGFGISREAWNIALADRGEENILRIERLAHNLNPRKTQHLIDALEKEVSDATWYLYPDVRPFLSFASHQAELHLLTLGDADFQRSKIEAAGINSFFTTITTTEKPKHELKNLPLSTVEHGIFINDSIQETRDMAGVYRWARHLHINREGVQLPLDFPFKSFRDLVELRVYLEELLDVQAAGKQTNPIPN
jgi:hypothetical protein